jgi:hypothetical protein
LAHYVIVRGDLPHGLQIAQTIHAAGESSPGGLPSGTIAVALAAPNETQLQVLGARLADAGIPFVPIVEGDGPYEGQLMALGLLPSQDRSAIRKVTSELPLVR